MKFDPWKCPACDVPAKGTVEHVEVVAGLIFDEEGNADYTGDTAVDYDNQSSITDELGRVKLECRCGTTWFAEQLD